MQEHFSFIGQLTRILSLGISLPGRCGLRLSLDST